MYLPASGKHDAPRHRLKNPFTMSKMRPDAALPIWITPKRQVRVFIPGVVRQAAQRGGAYRDRTDDPLLAKQVLSQLS